MKQILALAILLGSLTPFYSCDKGGPGGKASIRVVVRHHEALIPGATVKIGYDQTELPTTFDGSKVADSSAVTEFTNLKKGDYYLFAEGKDTAINETVSGGIPVTIRDKNNMLEITVPVTEGHAHD